MTKREQVWRAIVDLFWETGERVQIAAIQKRTRMSRAEVCRVARGMRDRVRRRFEPSTWPGNNARVWSCMPYGRALVLEFKSVEERCSDYRLVAERFAGDVKECSNCGHRTVTDGWVCWTCGYDDSEDEAA